MARDPTKTGGPPEDVIQHLIDVHTSNGTLDQIVGSAIGGSVQEQLNTQTGFVSGYTPAYGQELWSYTGGTTVTLLADINGGPGDSYAGLSGIQEFNGSMYFTAYDPAYGFELRKLTADGNVSLVADIYSGSGDSAPGAGTGGFTEFNGALYFSAFDPANGSELRKLDADGNVSLVADINIGSDSSGAGAFSGFAEFNGALYFGAFDSVHGWELRKLDAEGNVSLVADIYSGSGSSYPGGYYGGGLTVFNGALYFSAKDPINGAELRKLDPNGTVTLVADIWSGPGGSGPGGDIGPGTFTGFAEFNGALYFSAADPIHGLELRKLDTNGNVSLVADINIGSGDSISYFSRPVQFNGSLYFAAYDPLNGVELRRLDADGSVSLIADINPGAGSSNDSFYGFIEYNGNLYFKAFDPVHGAELRRLDGATGAIDTFDFTAGPDSSWAEPLGVVNGQLVIAAEFDRDGDGPGGPSWTMLVSDGTPTSVADFQVVDDGSGTFEPNIMFVSDGFLLM